MIKANVFKFSEYRRLCDENQYKPKYAFLIPQKNIELNNDSLIFCYDLSEGKTEEELHQDILNDGWNESFVSSMVNSDTKFNSDGLKVDFS